MLINGYNYYFVNKEKDICVENIEDALPDRTIRVTFERLEEEKRRITLEGGGRF